MTYRVELPVFAGPLDLLLHLIERAEIDIYDIPIAEITRQFLSYLRTMELLNLEIAGEFLVMAATLMQIKAKMLLPKPVTLADDTGEAEEEDPRRELVDRLVEYRRIKEAAELLRRLEEERALLYARQGGVFADQIVAPIAQEELSIWELIDAFQALLAQAEASGPEVPVPAEQVSVRQLMSEIVSSLETGDGPLDFSEFFRKYRTRRALVCAFMALLELIRLGRVMAYQDGVFGRIAIRLREPKGVAS